MSVFFLIQKNLTQTDRVTYLCTPDPAKDHDRLSFRIYINNIVVHPNQFTCHVCIGIKYAVITPLHKTYTYQRSNNNNNNNVYIIITCSHIVRKYLSHGIWLYIYIRVNGIEKHDSVNNTIMIIIKSTRVQSFISLYFLSHLVSLPFYLSGMQK